MRLSKPKASATLAKAAQTSPNGDISEVLGGTEIRIAYKIGYVLNFYREPSFRAIETEFGLTRPEIVTLIFLHFRDGVTASEICEFSGHLKANMSRGIIALEKKRLLRRKADRADNRRQNLFITAAGRAMYARYMPMLRAREQAMMACLSPSEREQFESLLDRLAAHVPQWSAVSDL
jgi:DNA-binding MarR family transcriptional regulator